MSITIELKNKKIKFDNSVVILMNSYRQLSLKDYEAGGILIGRENKETGNLIIEYATIPYEKDKRTRAFFYRKDKQHIEFYNKLYNENNGIYAYIGEWHTHPEDYPNYSYADIKNWGSIAKRNEDKGKIYYHVIVGNKEIRIWEYQYTLKDAKRIY
ncbi:MAG: Mov34/MPN/PAD-1 family protein [Bacillota bacterium]